MMEVKEIYLSPTTKIADDYLLQQKNIFSFFAYDCFAKDTYKERLEELKKRTYQREKLVNALSSYMKNVMYGQKGLETAKKLLDPNAVVVVGGQQPGVFTGPLYTIYKIVTIIQLAKKFELEYNVPVVPVFWIAGEDHDFDEINHVYVPQGRSLKKLSLETKSEKKSPLAYLQLNKEELKNFMKEMFQSMPETKHTKNLLEAIELILERSSTYTDFFAHLISWLFQEEGLVLLNSADPNIRRLEGDFFAQIIEKNVQIYEAFKQQTSRLVNLGYPAPVELQEDHACLFYVDEGKREKITRNADGTFFVGTKQLTKEQLVEIARNHPEKLSNNVVTRPVMQEFLLPVLAFVGGPGEIAYWSTLKGVFSLFDFAMPPVVPRLSFTILEEKHEKWMKEFQLNIEDAFSRIGDFKEQWLQKQKQWDLEQQFANAKELISKAHFPLQKLTYEICPSLKPFSEKNLAIIHSQLDLLKKKLETEIRSQFETELTRFDILQNTLQPLNKPQERIYNIFYFLNLYGMSLVMFLCQNDWEINEKHKILSLLFS